MYETADARGPERHVTRVDGELVESGHVLARQLEVEDPRRIWI